MPESNLTIDPFYDSNPITFLGRLLRYPRWFFRQVANSSGLSCHRTGPNSLFIMNNNENNGNGHKSSSNSASESNSVACGPDKGDIAFNFDDAVADIHDFDQCREYLPPDVKIICTDGEVEAHKFVLVLQSQFFKARFRFSNNHFFQHNNDTLEINNNNNSKTSQEMEIVDLSSFHLATKEITEVVIRFMYKGPTSYEYVTHENVFTILHMANFLQLEEMTQFCAKVLDQEMNKCWESNPDYVLEVHEIGQLLGEESLVNISLEHLKKFRQEPEFFFEKISYNGIKALLDKPESFSFRKLKSVCALVAVERETYLLNGVVRYLCHEKHSRLQHAGDLLGRLRLSFVADLLDMEKLGLGELCDIEQYPDVHELVFKANLYANKENLLENKKDESFWKPRPKTVKISVLSKRFGCFVYRLPKGGDKKTYMKNKRIDFERSPHIRIRSFSLFWKMRKSKKILGGISIKWSDETVNAAGQITGANLEENEVHLEEHEGVALRVADDHEFVRAVQVFQYGEEEKTTIREATYPNNCVYINKDFYSAIGTMGSKEHLAYFDGLKCTELHEGDKKNPDLCITSLRFKSSTLVDMPIKSDTKRTSNISLAAADVFPEEKFNLKDLAETNILKHNTFRKAFLQMIHR